MNARAIERLNVAVIALFYARVCVAYLVRESMSMYVCVCDCGHPDVIVCPPAFVLIDCTYIVCC